MTEDLDHLLARLQDQAAPPLFGLEARVWAAVGAHQRGLNPATLWGLRSAVAALLLLVGVLTQAASASTAPELSLFTPRSAIAPSTLLGEDQ